MAGVKVNIESCLYIMAIASLSIHCSIGERKFDRLIPPEVCDSASCPPQRNYEQRQLLCSYNCPDGLRYICLENGEEEQVTEFCAPSLECEPGEKGVFVIDRNDQTKVLMTVEPCPPDSYQRYSSDCIHACTSKRDDFTFLTKHFVLYSNGSNVRAPEVYCNYIDGYYSPNNITLFDFDDEFQHYFGTYCEHVSKKEPCKKGLMPLPNGTCVLPCTGGQIRDDHVDFICKPQSDESIILKQTTSGAKFTERKREQTTEKTNQSRPAVSSGFKLWIIIISVTVVILLIVVGVIVACFFMMKRRKNKRKDKTSNGGIEEQIPMEGEEPNADDGSDKESDMKETETLLENADERPLENGIHKHHVEVKVEKIVEKSPESERKEHPTKSKMKEHVKNINQNGTTEINNHATVQNVYINTTPPHADTVNALKGTADSVAAGAKAGELKKSHNDTLTTMRWNALNTQPESVGCLISDGNIAGTVFRVGTSCLMTAFHVISHIIKKDPDGPDHENNFDWLRLTCDRVYPNFNESVTDKPKIVSKVSCIFYNVTLDVAVLQFDVISDLPRKMILDTSGYLKPDRVYIIGFGHPENTLKKHIDPSCKVIPSNSSEIRNAHVWLLKDGRYYREKVGNPDLVDTGYHGYDDPHKIILNCYLEHGASGAPLLAVDNKRCVVVVGILTNGIPDFYFRLSPADQRAFPTAYRFEYGTRMKDIYHAIQEANPELAKDIFGEQ